MKVRVDESPLDLDSAEGIFILKKEDVTGENAMFFPSSQATEMIIIDQQDFLPKDQIDRIKALIAP